MGVRQAGGLVGMGPQPAVLQAAIRVLTGIGPVLPWIVACVPLSAQTGVIGGVGGIGAVGMQPVVALERFKAAFGQMHPDDRACVDAQPRHPLGIGDHVGLADQRRAHP